MLCVSTLSLGGLTIWAHQSHEPRALSSAPRYPFSWHLICHSPVGCWDSRGPRPIPAGPTWLNTAVGVVTENIAPVRTPPIITHLAAKYKTCATIAITVNVISFQKKQYFYILHNLDQYWHHSKESINNFRALFSRYNPDSWRQTRRTPSPHGPMRSLPLPALGSTVCFPPKQWVSKPSSLASLSFSFQMFAVFLCDNCTSTSISARLQGWVSRQAQVKMIKIT